MADLLAASMVVVVLYCLTRAFVPSLHCAHRRRDVDAWHVAMAGVMAAMLLVPSGRAFSVLALGVFVAGLGWALSHGVRRTTRAAYLRLAVGCAAMTVMLLPAATTASANAPTTPGGMHHMHHMDHAMPAMAHAGGDGRHGKLRSGPADDSPGAAARGAGCGPGRPSARLRASRRPARGAAGRGL